MERIQVAFVICLAAAYTATQAYGRECIAGQERGSDGKLHWVINEDPDGCTDLRMAGGVNMQRRVNPYVEKIVPPADITTQSEQPTDHDINECASSPCLNFGQCLNRVDMYICQCQSGFAGIHCDTESTSALNDASPCYGPFTTGSGNPMKRYPQDGFFDSPIKRLEFSVQSSNNVFLDLKDATSNNMIVIELGKMSKIEDGQGNKETSGTYDIDINPTARFWVTYINTMVKVGKDGEEIMEADIPDRSIKYIIFDSDEAADWQIYMPCDSP